MNWLREHIKRLLENRRWQTRWQIVGAVLAVLVVIAVAGGLTQGASSLSGALNAASMGVQVEDASPSLASASDADSSQSSSSSADSGAADSDTSKEAAAKSDGRSPSSSSEKSKANPDKGKLQNVRFDVKGSDDGAKELGDSPKVAAGARVKLQLSFEVKAGTLSDKSKDDRTVTYELPHGLAVSDDDGAKQDIEGLAKTSQEDKKLGTYQVKGGKLVMVFDDSEYEKLYSEDTKVAVDFWATAENESVSDAATIAFPGVGKLRVEPADPDIDVTKTSREQDAAAGEERHADYTVIVSSSTGTGDKITISDALAAGPNIASASYDKSSFKLKKFDSSDDSTGTNVKFDDDQLAIEKTDDGAKFKLSGLPALEEDERYELAYNVSADVSDPAQRSSLDNSATAKVEGRGVSESADASVAWGASKESALPAANPLEEVASESEDGGENVSAGTSNAEAPAGADEPQPLAQQGQEAQQQTQGVPQRTQLARALAPAVVTVANEAANPDKGLLKDAKFYKMRSGGSGTEEIENGGTVESNTHMQFQLLFEFPQGTLSGVSEDAHTVTFILPDGITADKDNAQEHDIIGTAGSPQQGKKIGTFRIAGNELIMAFSNSDVADLYDGTIDTTVSFWATASNSSVTDRVDIVFPNGDVIRVDPDTPDIAVGKSAVTEKNGSGGDRADGTGNRTRYADYTVTVSSTKGTGDTVTIDDTMSDANNIASTAYNSSSFVLKKYRSSSDTTGEIVDYDNKLTIDSQNGKAHFKMTGLQALGAGERYVLTYKATVVETDHTEDSWQNNTVEASIDGRDVDSNGNARVTWANRGNLNMTKRAQLTDYRNPDNPKERRIKYDLIVTTTYGSGTKIQIGDSASPRTNIDTSSWHGHETESFYDHDSFTLRKYSGSYQNNQTIDPNGGSDESNKLSKISWNNDNGNPSFGLEISEPLQKGEYYVLSYTATVYESDHDAPDTTMNNSAVARIYPAGIERVAARPSASVTWHNEIQKTGTFNQSTGYIDWTINVNRNNGAALGAVMEDTLQNDLVTNVRISRGNTTVKTLDLLSGNHSVATEGVDNNPSTYDPNTKKLHVVLGSWANQNATYTIRFSTKAPADGTVSNSAVFIKDGTTYGSQGINVGVNRVTNWGIQKSTGTNSGALDSSTGIYTMAWNATATFPDRDLAPNGNDGVLKLTDTLDDLTQEDGTSSSAFANLHYAVAKDLYAELTGASTSGATVTLTLHNDADSNGGVRIYTLRNGVFTSGSGDSAVNLEHVRLIPTLYGFDGNVINDPKTSNEHVKKFELVLTTDNESAINGRTLTVSNYHTLVNVSSLPPSTSARVNNSLSSNQTSGAATDSQGIRTLSNPLEKSVRTLVKSGSDNSRGEGSSSTFINHFDEGWSGTISGDYDATSGSNVLSDNSDGHSEKTVQFRLAINTAAMDSDTVTITDTLPEGMVFLNSRFHPVRLVYYRNGTYTELDSSNFKNGNTPTGGDYAGTSNANVSNDGRTIAFTINTDNVKNGTRQGKGQYYITYCATFKDDAAWNDLTMTSKSYRNNATMTANGTDYSADSMVNVTRQVNPVTKSQNGTLANNRKGKYKIVINPTASDLVPNADTVELVDELSGWNTGNNAGLMNPELDLASVHLYLYNPQAKDGLGVELDKSRYSLKYEHADGSDGYRRIRLTAPDSTAMVFVYDYEFKQGTSGDWGSRDGSNFVTTVGNTATLAGHTSNKVEESIRRAASEATGGGRLLSLYKVDQDNHANTLTGSLFDGYKWTSSGWVKMASDIQGNTEMQDGQYHPHSFDLSSAGVLQNDILYRLVETTPPAGYGRTYAYMVWLAQGETEDQAWSKITAGDQIPAVDIDGNPIKENGEQKYLSPSDVHFISYYGGNMYVEDKYQSITVTKNWSGSDGTPLAGDDSDLPNSVQLQLKQAVQGSGTWVNYGDEVTVTKDDKWKHTWSNLPQVDSEGRTYVYKVEEVGISESNGADSTGRWKATYLNDDGVTAGNITITNVRQYSLPSTGGNAFILWLCLAGGVCAAAGIAILAIRRISRG